MVSNQVGFDMGLLAGQYMGRIGHLYSPGGENGPWEGLPFALDNGAWPAFKNSRPWCESGWRRLMNWAVLSGMWPSWALVPDVVGDRAGTLLAWEKWHAVVGEYGFRKAFAVQDGMTYADVPTSDCVLFLGGSTEWKEGAIYPWCSRFPGRVHVGRVNSWSRLMKCWKAGAISIDGTGWYHKKSGQNRDLRKWLKETNEQYRNSQALPAGA